jgi:hypothetical protein
METKTTPRGNGGRAFLPPLIFILIGAGLYGGIHSVITFRLDNLPGTERYYYSRQYEEAVHPRKRANLVILGNSHAVHGIDPRYLDDGRIRAFNFSLNGSGPLFQWEWYTKVFRPSYPLPRLIVYGVDWFMFDGSWLTRKIEEDGAYLPLRRILFDFFHPLYTAGYDRFKTMMGNKFLIGGDRVQRAFPPKPKTGGPLQTDRYSDGYLPFDKPYFFRRVSRRDDLPTDLRQVKAFRELVGRIREEGIPLVFVQTPEHIPGRIPKTSAQKYLRDFSVLNGIPYLDYNGDRRSDLNGDGGNFSDWGHLNERGSARFSRMLKRDLDEVLDLHKIFGSGERGIRE